MRDIAAATCADTLIARWISRYGVPTQLTSDQSTQFTSAIWATLCQQLGIQHLPTTAFHPHANVMVERCHWQLKDALRAHLAGPDWSLRLPWVLRLLMGLRAAPTEDKGLWQPRSFSVLPWSCPSRSWTQISHRWREFIPKLWQSVPPPTSHPISYAQMVVKPPAALMLAAFVNVARAAQSPPYQRSTAAHTRSSPWAQRCSRCRWVSGKRWSP